MIYPPSTFNNFRTNQPDEVCNWFEQKFSTDVTFSNPGSIKNLRFGHQKTNFGSLTFSWLEFGTDTSSMVKSDDFYQLQIVVTGNNEIAKKDGDRVPDIGDIVIRNPRECYLSKTGSDCKRFFISIPKEAIERTYFNDFGATLKTPLNFILNNKPSQNKTTSLLSLFDTVCADAISDSPCFNSRRVQRPIEEAILSGILEFLPHSKSEHYEGSTPAAAPYYVRIAEDFIEANLTDAITMQDLIEATGVSSRSLSNGFKIFRDTTPFTYIKSERLKLTRKYLFAEHPIESSVTEIALRCGFTHLGKFSGDYRKLYGEAPSETLRNS